VSERQREGYKKRKIYIKRRESCINIERDSKREKMCVCVCEREREMDREREKEVRLERK
jgi:hypothetical protein